MNSKCCSKPAIKQYAGNYFCSECISICNVKPDKTLYMYLFLIFIMLINVNAQAPNTRCKIYRVNNIESIYQEYTLNPLHIEFIESNGNCRAISICDAKGIMQVTTIVLNEYNTTNNTYYTEQELFTPTVNRKIAQWYLEIRIPELLKSKNLEINLSNILICYNAGINYAVIYNKSKNVNDLPQETRNYLIKYITLM